MSAAARPLPIEAQRELTELRKQVHTFLMRIADGRSTWSDALIFAGKYARAVRKVGVAESDTPPPRPRRDLHVVRGLTMVLIYDAAGPHNFQTAELAADWICVALLDRAPTDAERTAIVHEINTRPTWFLSRAWLEDIAARRS